MLPVVVSGLLFHLAPVPNLFQEWLGSGWIWRDQQGQYFLKINNLASATHPPESLRRRLFYPLNYGEPADPASRVQRKPGSGVDSAQSIANAHWHRRTECAPMLARRVARRAVSRSEIDDDEVFLGDVAQRAAPVGGNVREPRTGRDALVRQAFRLVVDPPANQADPALVFGYFAHVALRRMKTG